MVDNPRGQLLILLSESLESLLEFQPMRLCDGVTVAEQVEAKQRLRLLRFDRAFENLAPE